MKVTVAFPTMTVAYDLPAEQAAAFLAKVLGDDQAAAYTALQAADMEPVAIAAVPHP